MAPAAGARRAHHLRQCGEIPAEPTPPEAIRPRREVSSSVSPSRSGPPSVPSRSMAVTTTARRAVAERVEPRLDREGRGVQQPWWRAPAGRRCRAVVRGRSPPAPEAPPIAPAHAGSRAPRSRAPPVDPRVEELLDVVVVRIPRPSRRPHRGRHASTIGRLSAEPDFAPSRSTTCSQFAPRRGLLGQAERVAVVAPLVEVPRSRRTARPSMRSIAGRSSIIAAPSGRAPGQPPPRSSPAGEPDLATSPGGTGPHSAPSAAAAATAPVVTGGDGFFADSGRRSARSTPMPARRCVEEPTVPPVGVIVFHCICGCFTPAARRTTRPRAPEPRTPGSSSEPHRGAGSRRRSRGTGARFDRPPAGASRPLAAEGLRTAAKPFAGQHERSAASASSGVESSAASAPRCSRAFSADAGCDAVVEGRRSQGAFVRGIATLTRTASRSVRATPLEAGLEDVVVLRPWRLLRCT